MDPNCIKKDQILVYNPTGKGFDIVQVVEENTDNIMKYNCKVKLLTGCMVGQIINASPAGLSVDKRTLAQVIINAGQVKSQVNIDNHTGDIHL